MLPLEILIGFGCLAVFNRLKSAQMAGKPKAMSQIKQLLRLSKQGWKSNRLREL